MAWTDEIMLVSYPADEDTQAALDSHGFPAVPDGEILTEVYADVKSVGFKEFYAAQQAGYTAEMKLGIYKAEYSGQRIVAIGDARFRVLRTYCDPKTPDLIELTLSDLSQQRSEAIGEI
jgi:hypothetical protein